MNLQEMTEVYDFAREIRQPSKDVLQVYNHQYKKMILREVHYDRRPILDLIHKDTMNILKRYYRSKK